MRRYLGPLLTILIVVVLLAGLSAANYIQIDRPPESEVEPLRTTYNSGPTGTRALYQLLEEAGYSVARWRESYRALKRAGADGALLVVIGPFSGAESLAPEEAEDLHEWLAQGGQLLVISRTPSAQFGHSAMSTTISPYESAATARPEQLVDERSDVLIAQPTAITRHTRGLAISKLAARLTFNSGSSKSASPPAEASPPATPVSLAATPATSDQPADSAQPVVKPAESPGRQAEQPDKEISAAESEPELASPVVHLGDGDGAVLADFEYGKGRVIFLSDPFVVANNGIGRGTNLVLVLNVLEALGAATSQPARRIFFDEFHHGYQQQGNPLVAYFRGTPVMWVFAQLALVAAFVVYTQGRRFARPLPLKAPDRHSPLEFVDSMAKLQEAAQARDLAVENIYPRFKARTCRTLGLPVSASAPEISARLKRRLKTTTPEQELQQVFVQCERVLTGEQLDDQRLIDLVAAMRRIASQLH